MPEATRWEGPASAEKGDVELILDDGTALRVHSAFLVVESPVLEDAVSLAREDKGEDKADMLRVPLPSVAVEEAQALISVLYSTGRDSYALSLSFEQLPLLVKICHQLGFQKLLCVVEQALVRHTGEFCPAEVQLQQYVTCKNAIELYWTARSKGLDSLQASCADYIAANVKKVAEAAPTDALAPVLAAVAVRLTDIQTQVDNATGATPSSRLVNIGNKLRPML